jgi:hypothetical protein
MISIAKLWSDKKKETVKQYPQENLRASSIGHPCLRFHYHSIVDWKLRPPVDYVLQSIFDEGNLHETDVIRQLMGPLNLKIQHLQQAYKIDDPLITAHIDGALIDGDKLYPFDVKSCNRQTFQKVNKTDDMINAKQVYLRQYPAQMQIYMEVTRSTDAPIIFKCKDTGELKDVWVARDDAEINRLKQKASLVYLSIETRTPPERCGDYDVCKHCDFKCVCLPDIKRGEGVKDIGETWLNLIDRRFELMPAYDEYEEIDSQLNDLRNECGPGEFTCGKYLMQVKKINVKVPLTWNEEIRPYLTKKFVSITAEAENEK